MPARNQTVTPEPKTTYHSAGKWATQFTILNSCMLTLCRHIWAILQARIPLLRGSQSTERPGGQPGQPKQRQPRWRCHAPKAPSSSSPSLFPEQHQRHDYSKAPQWHQFQEKTNKTAANHCARALWQVPKNPNKAIHRKLTKGHRLQLTK